jgi:hypothetical protein
MMKTLNYERPKRVIHCEDSKKYAHVLTKYFDCIYPHGSIAEPEGYVNTACFYNSPHWYPSTLADVVNIKRSPTGEIFYDKKSYAPFRQSHLWIEIRVNNVHAGYYCPKINVLVATDWTHVHSCENEEIVTEILRAVGARKVRRREKAPKVSLTIGSDPEFELMKLDGMKVVNAREYFGGTDPNIEIGVDGAGYQIELRPKPGGVRQHVKNVLALLQEFAKYERFDLLTKGDVYALGGHIHVGGVEPTKDVLQLLDDFLGKHVIDLSGEARGTYKCLTAYERKPYGFEYRTCPAAIFHDPRILRICLKIVRNVLEELVNKGTITYHYPVGAEDYYEHAKLTENEYKYFKWFVENYRAKLSNQTVLCAWKIRKINRPMYKLTISDNDVFNDQVRQALLTIPERFWLRKNIYVFGLRESRGSVYTFPTKLGKCISDFDPCISDNIVKVGIAYQARVTTDEKTIKRLLRDLVRYLRENKAITYKGKRGV